MRPLAAYFVCASPDGASADLCAALAATGVAGWPREHFTGVWRLEDSLGDGATPNGVFGAHVRWSSFLGLLRVLREAPETAGLRGADALAALLPDLQFVQVRPTRGWTAWFAGTGIEPHVVDPADLREDPRRAVVGLMRELQLDLLDAALPV